MFEYIRGTLTESSPHKATVDIQGLGYRIFIPLSTYQKLPQLGETICLHLSSVIREDAHKLFGFLSKSERDTFESLIAISGIGPKLAIALLGHLSLEELHLAVHHSNSKIIAKVPGIGKKTAERLIVELRDKVQDAPSTLPESQVGDMASDATHALINLGYHPIAAQRAVRKSLSEPSPPQELTALITKALQMAVKT